MNIQEYEWLVSADVRHTDGWSSIVVDLCEKIGAIVEAAGAKLSVRQVKEKMGGLRFYYYVDPIELRYRIDGLVRSAEERSRRTCTLCGASGMMHNAGGWIRPLCAAHVQARRSRQT